jgi:GcrA cell cycle regulator
MPSHPPSAPAHSLSGAAAKRTNHKHIELGAASEADAHARSLRRCEASPTWTEARVAQLARLWTDGVSASGIAEALGEVSRSAVLGKLHRLGLLGGRGEASAPRRYAGPISAAQAASTSPRCRPTPRAAFAPELAASSWNEAAFTPLPGSSPRNWLSRAFGECAFPVDGEGDGLMSCCAPTAPRSAYCPAHHAIAFRAISPAARAAEQRRWADAVAGWAA